MLKKYLVSASNAYLLDVGTLSNLEKAPQYREDVAEVTLMLSSDPQQPDKLLSGMDVLRNCRQNGVEFVKTRVMYYSCHPLLGFFLQLIKPIKRNSVTAGASVYKTKLSDLLQLQLTRGIRNRENAYQLRNKKWKIPPEEQKKRFEELYRSLKNGYNFQYPLFIGLNRQMGFKDQILQGHHRIGICQELGIEDVSISFWTYPRSVLHIFF